MFLKETAGKKTPHSWRLEFLQKIKANSFALSDTEENISGPFNREGSKFTFTKNTVINSPKVMRAELLGGNPFVLLAITKFGSFKKTMTSLSALQLRCRSILVIYIKEEISMSYGCYTSNWKPWRLLRLHLTIIIRNICINSNLDPPTKFSSSTGSTYFKDILLWKIPQMIMKIIPFSTRIIKSCTMKRSFPLWLWRKLNKNQD